MDLKIICVVGIVGLFTSEAKIWNDHGTGFGDTKADATTRVDSLNEVFLNFYRYEESSPSSPGTVNSLKTCLAVSTPPAALRAGVYALKASGGTVFLRHGIDLTSKLGCFDNNMMKSVSASSFQSCADAIESSGWANSFTFTAGGGCVGYVAWRPSISSQLSQFSGDTMFYIAENKINVFNDYHPPTVRTLAALSRHVGMVTMSDPCLNTAKIEFSYGSVSKTDEDVFYGTNFFYDLFDISLCTMDPPSPPINLTVTSYDHDGNVLGALSIQEPTIGSSGDSMHRFSGDYGDVCMHMLSATKDFDGAWTTCRKEEIASLPRETSVLSFSEYRNLISTISGVPDHFVSASCSQWENPCWSWIPPGMHVAADNFDGGSATVGSPSHWLIAKSTSNYNLAPVPLNTMSNVICLSFSGINPRKY